MAADIEKREDLNKTSNIFEENKSVTRCWWSRTADYQKMSEDEDTDNVSLPTNADSAKDIFDGCSNILKNMWIYVNMLYNLHQKRKMTKGLKERNFICIYKLKIQ